MAGGDHRAAYKNKVASQANRGGLLSAWVWKPNHIPELQAYFQVWAWRKLRGASELFFMPSSLLLD